MRTSDHEDDLKNGTSTVGTEDECPDDPDKMEPGMCGCGVSDDDSDRDGVEDCYDDCPKDPNKMLRGICGCGVSDDDNDSDGVPDCKDEDVDDTDTDVDTESDTIIDTEAGSCPVGVEFHPSLAYDDVVVEETEGTEYFDICPKGQVVIGYHGNLRELPDLVVHGQIQAICGTLDVISAGDNCKVEITTGESLPMRGTGTIPWTRMCPQDEIITGFFANTGADIDSITFKCAPLLITRDKNQYTISRGPNTALEIVGGDGGGQTAEADCLAGQVATATYARASTLIRGFGVGCEAPSLVD